MPRSLIIAVLYEGKDDPFLDAGPDHDPSHQVYGQAYGIEMQKHDDWNADVILLTSPNLLGSVTENTGVTVDDGDKSIVSAGTTNPVIDSQGRTTVSHLKHEKNNWLLVGHDSISAESTSITNLMAMAADSDCRIVLCLDSGDKKSSIDRVALWQSLNFKTPIFVLQNAANLDGESMKEFTRSIRAELADAGSAVRFAIEIPQEKAEEWAPTEDICGIFVVGNSHSIFCYVLEIAEKSGKSQG
jgi:hypothetical protein